MSLLVWEVANYYKHCDDWSSEVWDEDQKPEGAKLSNSERTCRIVKKVGICRSLSSIGNMRAAYDFFEIDWASDCAPLADQVQEWAKAVYDKCATP